MSADRARRIEFERAILVYLDEVYRYAFRIARDAERAEDLTQETFLQAWRSFDHFTMGTNARAWVYRILHNVRSHSLRGLARERATVGIDDVPAGALAYDPPLPAIFERRIVEEAFATLDDASRELVVLADVEGFTYREIGDILQVPLGTVMSRLSRARRRLRSLVSQHTHGVRAGERASGE